LPLNLAQQVLRTLWCGMSTRYYQNTHSRAQTLARAHNRTQTHIK